MSTPYANTTLLKKALNKAIFDNEQNLVKASAIASKISEVIDYFEENSSIFPTGTQDQTLRYDNTGNVVSTNVFKVTPSGALLNSNKLYTYHENSITLLPPYTGNKVIFYTQSNITITSLTGAIVGTGGPAVIFNVVWGSARNNLTSSLFSSGSRTVNSLAGQAFVLDGSVTIPAGSWICVTYAGNSGTITEFTLNFLSFEA